MTKFTKEQQISICNAVNTAIAKGWTVNVEQDGGCPFTIQGAIIKDNNLLGVNYNNSVLKPDKRIFTTKKVVIEIEDIYNPPIADTVPSYPDLSNPSP